jgi:hypothetical protein
MRVEFNKLALALTAAGLITGLAGCGGGGSGSGAVLPPPPVLNQTDRTFQIEFVDAITGQVIIQDSLSVTFSGTSLAKLRLAVDKNNDGQYDALPVTATTTDGVLPVMALSFDQANDSFKVSASGSNWLVAGAEIVPGSNDTVTVRLSKATNSTADYVAAAQTAQAASGQVTGTITVATSSAQSQENAQIQILSNTTAQRADGTTSVATGPLTVSVVRFAVSTVPLPLDTKAQGGSFSLGDPVGVVRFNIADSTGAAITQFSQPIKLSINLAAGAEFPGTTQPLTGGETNYPVSYFDETAKQWVRHTSDGTVTKNPDGSFTITFESDHLSLWTLNPPYNPVDSCIFSTVNLTGRPVGDATPLMLSLTGSTPGSSFSKTIGPVADNSLTLLYAPLEPVNITVTSPAGVTVSPTPANLCSLTQPVPILISGLAPQTPATLTVNVTETCSNDAAVSRVLPTSVYYQYKLPSGLYTTLGGWTGDDGSIAMDSVPLNTRGELKIWNPYLSTGAGYVYPENPASSGSYTIDEVAKTLNYNIPVTCQIVTGSTQP